MLSKVDTTPLEVTGATEHILVQDAEINKTFSNGQYYIKCGEITITPGKYYFAGYVRMGGTYQVGLSFNSQNGNTTYLSANTSNTNGVNKMIVGGSAAQPVTITEKTIQWGITSPGNDTYTRYCSGVYLHKVVSFILKNVYTHKSLPREEKTIGNKAKSTLFGTHIDNSRYTGE